ncbi:MAG: acetolactate synthase large subunit [Hyphomicrobiales bacterium]
MMKASDIFVKALVNEGVEYIFAVPGEENLDLIDSLFKSNIKLIVTRHEQGAGFMAATYGRLTGKPGVCLSTLGPGATNLVTCASYGLLGGFPMMLITGQKPIRKNKQGRFQLLNICRMMEPITKFSHQLVSEDNISYIIRDTFRIATNEKPGPVHIEFPEDIARGTTDQDVFEVIRPNIPNADNDAIEEAARMIEEAKYPILLVASGANRHDIHEPLLKLIDKIEIPFCNTQMGKGVIDERHPCYLGTAALSSNDYLHCALDRSDLVINIGHDVVEKPPFIMTQSGKKKVIHINYFPAEIDNVYFPQLEVIGELSYTINKLTETINVSDKWDKGYFHRIKNEMEKNVYKLPEDTSFPNIPERIVADIRAVMPDDGILTLDNGMYKIWFARQYKAHMPNTILLDNALATMGAGLPSAIGARFVYPNCKIVAICGDGGFMMNSQELETATRYNLDLVVIVLVDKAFGMIKWKQAGAGLKVQGLDFNNPDFVKYAESYGCKGHRISKTGELSKCLSSCLEQKGVHLIEVPVNYDENEKVFYDELFKKTCIL